MCGRGEPGAPRRAPHGQMDRQQQVLPTCSVTHPRPPPSPLLQVLLQPAQLCLSFPTLHP